MTRNRPPWSWPGAVALIIAGSLALGWAGALIIAAAHPMPTSPEGLNLLGSLGQTMAGAVAAYLGYQVGAHAPNDRDNHADDVNAAPGEPLPPTPPEPPGESESPVSHRP